MKQGVAEALGQARGDLAAAATMVARHGDDRLDLGTRTRLGAGRAEGLRALPRQRIVLQISLDSPTPGRHDLHRGSGTWARARAGIQHARAQGFRVRLAATVSTDAEAEEFRQFLDEEKIAAEDRVIRRMALRGAASEGVAVSRADLVPEVTISADGVYWHPVGAEDADGEEVGGVLVGADADGVAGVGAATVADDDVGVIGDVIDDLALPLVAPLRTEDCEIHTVLSRQSSVMSRKSSVIGPRHQSQPLAGNGSPHTFVVGQRLHLGHR